MKKQSTSWTEKIKAAQASGTTVTAWCKENGVSVRQFYYWRKKLQQAEPADEHEFVEIGRPEIENKEMSSNQNAVEAVLSYGGFRLEIMENTSEKTIRKVMQVMQNAQGSL